MKRLSSCRIGFEDFKKLRNKQFSHGWKIFLLSSFSVLLSGCLSDTSYAPVVEAGQQQTTEPTTYVVRKGDTLYSIAWTFGLDYRSLAEANGLRSPYEIHPGQRLRVQGLPRHSYAKNTLKKEKTLKVYRRSKSNSPVIAQQKAASNQRVSSWRWPARGRIVEGYSSKLTGNRGIDIAGRLGEPVRAAAPGIVVYSGDGVRGYGNLLIIKHNDSYLSAYAFNKKLLVKLGQQVKAGQEIAKMGRDNAGRVMLHFEIRHNGIPVNPQRYLHS